MSRFFKYLNYNCESLENIKVHMHMGISENVKTGIFLTKGQNIIESGFVHEDVGCLPAYIPYYISEDEIQKLTITQYKNIIRILIKKYKESLVDDKIKELSKDFE